MGENCKSERCTTDSDINSAEKLTTYLAAETSPPLILANPSFETTPPFNLLENCQ